MRIDEFDLEKREKAAVVPSPGMCIYCYEVLPPEKLTDEHVIPYALGADILIFEKSCCTICQKEITRYEQTVLRQQLGAFRAQVDAPTRKLKDRVKSIDIHFVEVDSNETKMRDLGTKSFPIEDAPLILNLWQFPPAKIFQVSTKHADRPWSYFRKAEIDAISRQVREETGAAHLAVGLGQINRVKYQRFLAKTAHAFVSAKIGPDAFDPYLTDIVLNRTENGDQFVGDIYGVHEFQTQPENTLQISMGRLTDGPAAGSIAVYLQLYPSIESPEHVIIVGKPLVDLDMVFSE